MVRLSFNTDYKAPQLKNKDGMSVANGIFAEILKSKE